MHFFECKFLLYLLFMKVENQDKDGYENHDNEATHFDCERGNHGDIYFEEQTGLRCRLCGAVLLESRYVIPKLVSNFNSEVFFCPHERF